MSPPLRPHGRLRADRVALADMHGRRVGERGESGCGTLMQNRDEKEEMKEQNGGLDCHRMGKKEIDRMEGGQVHCMWNVQFK